MRRRPNPLLFVLLVACQEETLQEAQAVLDVCVRADAPEDECNRPLDFGEQPLTVARDVTLHIVNRGDIALQLEAVTSSDPALTVVEFPATVAVATSAPLRLALQPLALGATEAQLELRSNDSQDPVRTLRATWTGTPKPVPHLELCLDDACSGEVLLDFGAVRRSQRESRTVVVRNVGDATLQITDVQREGDSTTPGEIVIGTSTRPGFLPPGGEAPVLIVYEPADGSADELQLVFTSDDPAQPRATLTVRGTSQDNLPPVADARVAGTELVLADVAVGEVITLDGTGSQDPEGDPLLYAWTLYAPAASSSSLDAPTASRVTLVPDTSGTYRIELLVTDSLGQVSSPSGLVLLRARPRHALRVSLDWPDGGDVDLHLVAPAGSLFGARDCSFENPALDLADPATTDDDLILEVDAEAAPGHEEVTIVAPPEGTYGIWAHYFDDDGGGSATVTARVMINDSGIYGLQETINLPTACALWHVADVDFPQGSITPSVAPLAQQCR